MAFMVILGRCCGCVADNFLIITAIRLEIFLFLGPHPVPRPGQAGKIAPLMGLP